jgi:hypothetical protein
VNFLSFSIRGAASSVLFVELVAVFLVSGSCGSALRVDGLRAFVVD